MEKCAGRKGCLRPVTLIYKGVPLCDHHHRLLCRRQDREEAAEEDGAVCDCGLHAGPPPRGRSTRHGAVSFTSKFVEVDGKKVHTLVPFDVTTKRRHAVPTEDVQCAGGQPEGEPGALGPDLPRGVK